MTCHDTSGSDDSVSSVSSDSEVEECAQRPWPIGQKRPPPSPRPATPAPAPSPAQPIDNNNDRDDFMGDGQPVKNGDSFGGVASRHSASYRSVALRSGGIITRLTAGLSWDFRLNGGFKYIGNSTLSAFEGWEYISKSPGLSFFWENVSEVLTGYGMCYSSPTHMFQIESFAARGGRVFSSLDLSGLGKMYNPRTPVVLCFTGDVPSLDVKIVSHTKNRVNGVYKAIPGSVFVLFGHQFWHDGKTREGLHFEIEKQRTCSTNHFGLCVFATIESTAPVSPPRQRRRVMPTTELSKSLEDLTLELKEYVKQ